jgi:UDP-N-acetylmuramoylalanine-D-glutamate ligase
MSHSPSGLTVVLQGAAPPRAFEPDVEVVYQGASKGEAEAMLRWNHPDVLVINPKVGWHQQLAEKARALGARVLALVSPTQEVGSNVQMSIG